MTSVLHGVKVLDEFGQFHTTLMVTFCMVCLVIYQFMMKYASDLHFVATCLYHSRDLIRFFARHGIRLHVLVALQYLAEISLLARRGITLQLVSFWQGLLILMLS